MIASKAVHIGLGLKIFLAGIGIAHAQGVQVPSGDTVYHAAHFDQDWQIPYDNGVKLKSMIEKFGSPSLAGKKVAIVTWFASTHENGREVKWGEPQRNALDKVAKAGALSLIKFSTHDPNFRQYPKIFLHKDIAAGRHDPYFAYMAGVIKRFGQPVFISIDHEMNGTWYPYSEAYNGAIGAAPAKSTAADYVAAWKRIVTVFRSQGVSNAVWMWSPNAEDVGGVPFESYYPGDGFVDWVGVSMYSDNLPTNLDRLYNFAQTHRKPVFVNEWATAPTKNANFAKYRQRPFPGEATWVADFFKNLETRYPGVKGISWFNTNKPWEDNFLLERVPQQARTYATEVKKPRYVASAGAAQPQANYATPRLEEAPREIVPRVAAGTAPAPVSRPPVENVPVENVPVESTARPRPRLRLKVLP